MAYSAFKSFCIACGMVMVLWAKAASDKAKNKGMARIIFFIIVYNVQ